MSDRRPSWRSLIRVRSVDLLVAVLLAALGFGAAVQVRSTQVDGILASARSEDLVRILDDLSGRTERLRQEVTDLTAARVRLTMDGNAAALQEARRRTQVLGVLAGTLAAAGPGVTLTVADPDNGVRAEVLLDALEELRDAGAEAVQLSGAAAGPVRVVASTALVDDAGGVRVDGVLLTAPYTFTVIGDQSTLASSLRIPGGVIATVARVGGRAEVTPSDALEVGALRPLPTPRYARPAPGS
ncbi:MAG TPA: DUF881 domain-containing protein [Mycobacteriales bacterium]|jgi:uncharacterized protein YlxW (UPF0749 family)|nr:DUF881 domain-containing protein [Mycobacteriales bacterium]